ncbi:lipoprotein [Acinetobacter ursingii]|nr:lipoprotein [Acinetobacter ursingii]ENV75793.1 hypothetical protein F944_02187 [Acinetobacter ursingii DSM 16037 = CIP 107286]
MMKKISYLAIAVSLVTLAGCGVADQVILG